MTRKKSILITWVIAIPLFITVIISDENIKAKGNINNWKIEEAEQQIPLNLLTTYYSLFSELTLNIFHGERLTEKEEIRLSLQNFFQLIASESDAKQEEESTERTTVNKLNERDKDKEQPSEPASEQQVALQALADDYANGTLRGKIFNYEFQFSQNNYKGKVSENKEVAYQRGSSSVLITAPHTTTHIREGDRKLAESYTGAIALLLNEYADSHVVYSTKESRDGNYYNDTAFKEELDKVISENNITQVIDLHGAAQSRPFQVDIGTDNGNLISGKRVAELKTSLEDQGFTKVKENHTFTASHSGTTANYVANQHGVEAMQVELNRRLRDPRRDLDSFYRLVYAMVEFVGKQ